MVVSQKNSVIMNSTFQRTDFNVAKCDGVTQEK
jgi:hypothetical protein